MTIYAKLLRLPFFQGIDRDELEAMASKIRFDFQKYDEGAWIARENDRCATLTLVMTGSVEAEAISADHSYSLREQIDAPCAIEPERIFGLRQHLARGYRATTPCNVLRLQKDDVLRLCAQSLVSSSMSSTRSALLPSEQGRLSGARRPRPFPARSPPSWPTAVSGLLAPRRSPSA